MKNLLVVDGNSILNRAFYGIRPLSTKDGLPTNAVYGFITILKKHLDSLTPDYMVCAFDLKAPTFRHKLYDAYKATRHAMPDELFAQLPYAKTAARAMGFRVVEREGYEADDVIGTVAAMAEADGGIASYILTGDRDSLQLISDKTAVILVRTKEDALYDTKRFTDEYGIAPSQFVDVKALMGDSSDNVPGVRGVGEKTALKLIQSAGSLEGLYADETLAGSKGALLEKLREGRESAFLSQRLCTIEKNAPLGVSVNELYSPGQDSAALSELFGELEFSALAKRFDLTGEHTGAGASLELPKICDIDAAALASLPDGGAVAFECSDFVCDLCVFADGALYRYSGGDGEAIGSFFASHTVVCHDLKSLLYKTAPFAPDIKCSFDTMLAAYLISPGDGTYPLEKLVSKYLSAQCANVGAAFEAYLVSLLQPVLAEALERDGMTGLLLDIEIPLSRVLFEMEREGFLLDGDGLMQYMKKLSATAEILAQSIYEAAGGEFNINSPKQLGDVLFGRLGIPPVKKTKSGYSTDADTLEKLRNAYPVVGDILEYRHVAKLIGTYGESLCAMRDENGRVHTSFNQTGTATGRLSSTEPNMQNIPVRGEMGREIRRYFTARDGYVLIDADYSQIELRILCELSGDTAMLEAFSSGADIHVSTAARVFGVDEKLVTPEMRTRAKAVNFGIVYGIGEYSLSQDLGISRKSAGEYIRSYLATYPEVDAYLKNTVAAAKENGYTKTIFARRRPIPELNSSNKNIIAFGERVAMNSPIQGSAADIIKIAMINARRALRAAGIDARLIMQVHDELIVEAARDCAGAASEILKREMENAVSMRIKLTSEVGSGDNWFEAH